MNTNGNAVGQESGAGTDYGSNEETAALLGRPPPPPVVVAAASQGKPVLTRQDRATFLVASPQLSVSGLGGSEESGTNEDPATRSVPDIELHCRLDGEPQHCRSFSSNSSNSRSSNSSRSRSRSSSSRRCSSRSCRRSRHPTGRPGSRINTDAGATEGIPLRPPRPFTWPAASPERA
ncbi:uncharacterized protein LOC105205591 isoform X2 [Solenopsis invicta]|uniref:uncharacterized protein LOC105205591 isoform X2 n=1 Tax=Solenopsis invicta TaxID=13686 RepID=UPI00193E272E|nr:uncharacterized protein LOC105205591 isoform X2 [Solenopsis invicta]